MKELIEKQRELINFLDDLSDILTKEQWLERKILFDEVAALESQLSGKEWYEGEFIEWIGFEVPHRLYYREISNTWFYGSKEMTTEQLYQYWQLIKQE